MPTLIRTPKEFNEANSRFWRERRIVLYERMADPAISETASEAWRAQQSRAVPLANQFSLETALEDAERAGQRFLKQLARKGGTVRKTDALQLLIEKIVERRPSISRDELLNSLDAAKHPGIIQDIDTAFIHFTNHKDTTKKARISGLKDRLTRAKKKHQSR
jgi:hypothetical protein